MSTTPNAQLHITLCDCPHVNFVIVEDGKVAHFACTPEKALQIADGLKALAQDGLVRKRVDTIGLPQGRA